MKKDLLALLFVVLVVAVLVKGTHIQSVDEYYLTHIDDITETSETVTISIRCDTILDNWEDLGPRPAVGGVCTAGRGDPAGDGVCAAGGGHGIRYPQPGGAL